MTITLDSIRSTFNWTTPTLTVAAHWTAIGNTARGRLVSVQTRSSSRTVRRVTWAVPLHRGRTIDAQLTIKGSGDLDIFSLKRLVEARFLKPARIALAFGDGFTARIRLSQLEMPSDRIRWDTVRITDNGSAMTVSGDPGDEIPITATTLRYLADPAYAEKVKSKRKSIRLSRDEVRELAEANPPPPEWYGEPTRDLIRSSWK